MQRFIGYARVSTPDQNLDLQVEELRNKGGCTHIYQEKISGADTERQEFKVMMEDLQEGDTLVVTSLDRLSRSVVDLLNTVELLDKKGVKLKSIRDGGFFLNPSESTSKFILTIIGAVAEMERGLLRERQRAGIERAKLLGKYKGRKPIDKPENWDKVIKRCYQDNEITATQAMDILGLKKTTFYKLAKEDPIFQKYKLRNQGRVSITDIDFNSLTEDELSKLKNKIKERENKNILNDNNVGHNTHSIQAPPTDILSLNDIPSLNYIPSLNAIPMQQYQQATEQYTPQPLNIPPPVKSLNQNIPQPSEPVAPTSEPPPVINTAGIGDSGIGDLDLDLDFDLDLDLDLDIDVDVELDPEPYEENK